MAKKVKAKKRPAVLVRFYKEDLSRLSAVCAEACTPRENFIRRAVLAAIDREGKADARAARVKRARSAAERKPS